MVAICAWFWAAEGKACSGARQRRGCGVAAPAGCAARTLDVGGVRLHLRAAARARLGPRVDGPRRPPAQHGRRGASAGAGGPRAEACAQTELRRQGQKRTSGCTARSLRRQRTRRPGSAWPTPGPPAARRCKSAKVARASGLWAAERAAGARLSAWRVRPARQQLRGVARARAAWGSTPRRRLARQDMKQACRAELPRLACGHRARTASICDRPCEQEASAAACACVQRRRASAYSAGGLQALRRAPPARSLFAALSWAAPRRRRAACRPQRPPRVS